MAYSVASIKIMKFGLDVPTTGEYSEPHVLANLAVEAEKAGWNGFFVWDVIFARDDMRIPVADAWIGLAEIALRTSKIRLGLMVEPLARDRPYLVARRLASLDNLSQGRVICTVGLGYQDLEFTPFGEEVGQSIRGEKLDEALQILSGLWTTDGFSFAGRYYSIDHVTMNPKPAQTPRIPLWVAGGWPLLGPFRRGANWDGICLKGINMKTHEPLNPEEFGQCVDFTLRRRKSNSPFEIVMTGMTPGDGSRETDNTLPFQEKGATWWIEQGISRSVDEYRTRIQAGPPTK